jgi:hypothetical protein
MAALDAAAMGGLKADQMAALDAAAMGGLGADQLGGLAPTAMGGFDQTKINALDVAAIAGFKSDQMAALPPTAMRGFGLDQMKGLAPTAMAGLGADQMGAIDPLAIAGLDINQMKALDPTAMGGLGADQMAALDATAMGGLGKDQMAALDPLAMAGMKGDQMAALDPLAMAGLAQDQMAALDPLAMAGMKVDQMAALDPLAMKGFAQDQMAALDANAVAGLKQDQVANLTKDAVGGLGADAFAQLPDDALKGLSKDNLGGLDTGVVNTFDDATIAKLDPASVKSLAGDDFSKLMTNVDPTKVTAAAVADLLPTGWDLDATTGKLTPPPGAKLQLKAIDKVASTNINDTDLPPLPDLSKDLALGGGADTGGGGVLAGLDSALDAAVGAGAFKFEQRTDGILNLKTPGAADGDAPAAAFIPDTSKMTQAPAGTPAGVSQLASGAFVVTTPDGMSIPLNPALANPDAVKDLLPADSKITIGASGAASISDLGDGDSTPITGIPTPILVESDKAAGTYRSGTGPDAKIEIVDASGKAQVLTPAFKGKEELETALDGFGATNVQAKTDGSIDLSFGGADITLKPYFQVEKDKLKPDGSKFPNGVSIVGDKFYMTTKDGTQELAAVTKPAAATAAATGT